MVDIVCDQRQIGREQQGCQDARQQQRRNLPRHGKIEAALLSEPQAGFLIRQRQSFFPDVPGAEPDKEKDDNQQRMDRHGFIHRVIENGAEGHINEDRIAVQQSALLKVDAGEQPVSLQKARLDAVRRAAVALFVIDDVAFIQEIIGYLRGRDQDFTRGVFDNAQIAGNGLSYALKVYGIDVGVLRPLDEQPSVLQTGRVINHIVLKQHSHRFQHAGLTPVQFKRHGVFGRDDAALIGEVVEVGSLPVIFAGFEGLHRHAEIVEKRL